MAETIELLYELFSSLPRGAPGSKETTLSALTRLGPLAYDSRALDVGCGTGAQSQVLAAAGLDVTAVDVAPSVLTELDKRVEDAGLAEKVSPVAADMNALPFRQETFSLVWSESAIYNLGFGAGIKTLAEYVAPGGFLGVSDLVWLTDDPSPENRGFWAAEYPKMIGLDRARDLVREAGLELMDDFLLPEFDWNENFYAHLERALPGFAARHEGEPNAEELVALCRKEMDLRRRFGHEYGMALFLMRRP